LLDEAAAAELDATTVTTTGPVALAFVVVVDDALLVELAPMDAVNGLFVTTT